MTHNMALIQVTVMLGIFDIVDQFLILIFKIFNTLVIIYFIFIYLFINLDIKRFKTWNMNNYANV